jgi:hypothetical protein
MEASNAQDAVKLQEVEATKNEHLKKYEASVKVLENMKVATEIAKMERLRAIKMIEATLSSLNADTLRGGADKAKK